MQSSVQNGCKAGTKERLINSVCDSGRAALTQDRMLELKCSKWVKDVIMKRDRVYARVWILVPIQ